jgi:hypothetical protein
MAEEKNWLQGPLDQLGKMVQINGVPLFLIADLPEGAYVQVIHGENPMGQAMPGPQIAKGAMLCVIPREVAAQMRPGIKAMEAEMAKGAIGQPGVMGGRPVAPSAFDKPDPDFGRPN